MCYFYPKNNIGKLHCVMVPIAPMVQSTPWLFCLLERASWWEPLPDQFFLFQIVDQEIVTLKDDFQNLYLVSPPDQQEDLVGRDVEDGKSSCLSRASKVSNPPCSPFSFEGFSPHQHRLSPSAAEVDDEDLFSEGDQDPDDLPSNSPLLKRLPFRQWCSDLSSREATWIKGLCNLGIDQGVAELIPNCHKESTKRQYQHAWQICLSWCYNRGISTEDVLTSTIINFQEENFQMMIVP